MKPHCTGLVPRHVTALVLVVCMGHMILLFTWASNSAILDIDLHSSEVRTIEMLNDKSQAGYVQDIEYSSLDDNEIDYLSERKSDRPNVPVNNQGYIRRKDLKRQYRSKIEHRFRSNSPDKVGETRIPKLNVKDQKHYATMTPVPLSPRNQRVGVNKASELSESHEIQPGLRGVKSQGGGHQIVVKRPSNRNNRVSIKRQIPAEFPIESPGDYQASRRRGLSYPDDTAPPRGIKAPLQHTNLSSVHQADEMVFSSETNGSKTRSQSHRQKLDDIQGGPFIKEIEGGNGMGGTPQKPLAYSDQALRAFYADKKEDIGINFQYSISPQFLCEISEDSPNGVDMVTVIHSHPANRAQRDAVRNTWGRVARDYDRLNQIRLVFVLGIEDSVGQRDLILREAKAYNDILQGHFKDSYDNLSVKSLYAINWVAQNCTSASYMIKADDDSYIEISTLIQHLVILNKSQSTNITVIGAVNSKSRVIRSGLWQVSMTSFPFEYYPQYCTGCAYILSTSILQHLLAASRRTALIPVEDAYITGILVTLIGQKCINLEQLPQWFMGPSHTNICKLIKGTLFGLHSVSFETMYTIHKHLSVGNSTMCPS